jgi:CMP-N,N'-diacetyllegionaminic acid synthase
MGNKVLCVIPCRKGSKRLPDKTIKLFKSRPLIEYTIDQACKLFKIDQIIINTDYNFNYEPIKTYKRPPELCGDDITTEQVLREMIQHYPDCELIVLLQITSPNRHIDTIKECVQQAYITEMDTRTTYIDDKPDGQCYVYWVKNGFEWDKVSNLIMSQTYSPDINTQLDFEVAEILHDL